jgi:heat shock protein 4
LVKIKEIAEAALQSPVSDVVISIPSYYRSTQRKALLDAAKIARLNILRIMPELTASALLYGIPKPDLPDDISRPKYVCFVDIGHSSYSVGIFAYTKGQVCVKGLACDPNLGGRDFDDVLAKHLVTEFQHKYKINISSSKRALHRLRAACERSKKILSANSTTVLSVDCIMEDKDVSAELTRTLFESLSQSLIDRLAAPLETALAMASVSPQDISELEIVGGTTRIPAVKQRLVSFFSRDILFTTLNQDEAVARGCAFQCAIQSPIMKVKEFHIQDLNTFPIHLGWSRKTEGSDSTKESNFEGHLALFPTGSVLPCAKLVTLPSAQSDLTLHAFYADTNVSLGIWDLKCKSGQVPISNSGPFPVGSVSDGDSSAQAYDNSATQEPSAYMKIQAKLTWDGLCQIDKGHIYESTQAEPLPSDEGAATADSTQVKRKVRKSDLEIVLLPTPEVLSTKQLDLLQEHEASLAAHDKLVVDTENQRNALEEYIYSTRDYLHQFSSLAGAEYSAIEAKCKEIEDWLYSDDHGASDSSDVSSPLGATKHAYMKKRSELETISKRFITSIQEHQAWQDLGSAAASILQQLETLHKNFPLSLEHPDSKSLFSHLSMLSSTKNPPTTPKWSLDQIKQEHEKIMSRFNTISLHAKESRSQGQQNSTSADDVTCTSTTTATSEDNSIDPMET